MQNSFVIVFGVGGVGSHVVNMLARSGVSRIKIVDFDRVSLSSLNRHSFAVRQDVGTSKVECIKKYIGNILPHIKIQTVETYVTVQNAAELLADPADYVIDCIDNMDAKCELVSICKERGIRMIVSGGAGMKADPTKLQIRDIADVKYDNLINRLKRALNKKGIKGGKSGITVAFSYEQSQKQLLPLNQKQDSDPDAFKVFDNYRIRIVPVLGTMPAIIGMSIASYVLCELAEQPYKPFETDYIKSTLLNRLYQQLLNDERKKGITIKDMQSDMQQIAIVAKQVYQWKCLVTEKRETNPRVVRWNPSKEATIDNLAFMSKSAYENHLKLASMEEVEKYYTKQVIESFQTKATKAKKLLESGFNVFV